MYGWRARLGLIMPSNNTVIEPELSPILPPGITIHGHRIGVRPKERKGDWMEIMRQDAVQNMFKLSPVDCAAYCCLTTSFYKGLAWDQQLLKDMKRDFAKPVTTAATAMLRALKALKAKKISIASPFKSEVNEKLEEFLNENNLSIMRMKALDPAPTPEEVVRLPTAAAYKLAKDALHPDSDAIFICATDLPTLTVIDALERDLGKPVISTNQAILWDMLRLINIKACIVGYGSLLRDGMTTENGRLIPT